MTSLLRDTLARMRRPLGMARRRARAVWTRLFHRSRRTRAREMVERQPGVRSVVFVCLGNICRSPYAEVRFRQLTGGRIAAASVGFIGPDRRSPEHARAAARARGLDLEDHRSRLVTRDDMAGADLVVLVDPAHARRLRARFGPVATPVLVLADLDPVPPPSRRILDPWGGPPEAFHDVFEQIDRCLAGLVEVLPPASGMGAGGAAAGGRGQHPGRGGP